MTKKLSDCDYCKHAHVLRYSKEWKVKEWYCVKFKQRIPVEIIIINCPEFEEL